jgi:hypothetical protein
MKQALFIAGVALFGLAGCQGDFSHQGEGKRLVVTTAAGISVGSPTQKLAVSVTHPTSFTLRIEALQPDGALDDSFNGFVRISAQPGTVESQARNVQLHAGVADGVVVPVLGAFGDAHIWAEDLGYEPASPDRVPPPECADHLDNNHNGLVDYPADPGCYAPNDDTEDLGTYATGVSETLYFELPRIAYVRGYDPADNGNGNATYFPNEQVQVDTGWRGGTTYDFSTVVIRVSSTGFYAQDLETDPGAPNGYGGIYAYNFSTPPLMRVCDRVQALGGTSSDFYGFTELNYPTWQLEYWDSTQRPCMVPEPTLLGIHDLEAPTRLWQLEATLVRVQTAGTVGVHIASHFGPQNVPLVNGVWTPGPDASNCDFDHTGKINYSDPMEGPCANACNGTSSAAPTDPECSEYSAYASQGDFMLLVADSTSGGHTRIQANGSAANGFDPVSARGMTIGAFAGTVSYFSGGEQFTIEARCQDDIVMSPAMPPVSSDTACVHPRTSIDPTPNSQ